ncbi:MAG: T9SS type A sorting domain-containing protein, partial [Candidatus Marinimicrobia bacterium]|nr:T9SS type A sorting domain-containing protein [Candidatus Neomarinimicrobiota bacterium]
DCAGECGGSAVEDECGVCNGSGIADGACDCEGNFPENNFDCAGSCIAELDCYGDCGGSALIDECGSCGGGGPSTECWDGSFVCDESGCPDETVTSNISILPGWNWFSVNTASDDMSLSNVLSSIDGSSNYIKSQGAYADYYDSFGWWGTLESINNAEMYKLDATSPNAIEFTGYPVEVSSVNIELSVGWNWIGYTPQVSMSLGSALSSIDGLATYIKSQTAYADYYDGFGWWGTFENMNPYTGYMISTMGSGALVYPESDVFSNDTDESIDELVRENSIELNPHDYEFNGSITAEVLVNDEFVVSQGDILNAYIDNEYRGSAPAITNPFNEKLIFPLMVYCNEWNKSLTFKYYNQESDEWFDIQDDIEFAADMALGNAINTVQLSMVDEAQIVEFRLNSIYPNPFNPVTNISFSIPDDSFINIEIYNLAGKQIALIVESQLKMGSYNYSWDATQYPSGLYIVSIQGSSESGSFNKSQKVVLMK